jgi:hypothetical protein
MGCCNEAGCRRKEPIRITRGGLSRKWYAATRTNGAWVLEKHELHPDTQAELTEMADSHAWLAAVESAMGGRQQILDALGLEMKPTRGDR